MTRRARGAHATAIGSAALVAALVLIVVPARAQQGQGGIAGLPPANSSAANAAQTIASHLQEILTSFDACKDADPQEGGLYVTASSQYLRDKSVAAALARTDEVMRQEARRRGANPEQVLAAQRAAQTELGRRIRAQAQADAAGVVKICRDLIADFRLHNGAFRAPEQMYPREFTTLSRWR